jgi:hypothetical protein
MYEVSKVWRYFSGFKGVHCQHNVEHHEVADGRNTLQKGKKPGNVFCGCREVILLLGFGHGVKKCIVKCCYIKNPQAKLDKHIQETTQKSLQFDLGRHFKVNNR